MLNIYSPITIHASLARQLQSPSFLPIKQHTKLRYSISECNSNINRRNPTFSALDISPYFLRNPMARKRGSGQRQQVNANVPSANIQWRADLGDDTRQRHGNGLKALERSPWNAPHPLRELVVPRIVQGDISDGHIMTFDSCGRQKEQVGQTQGMRILRWCS